MKAVKEAEEMPELIILDIYGTILSADELGRIIRPGLMEFLEHYKDKNIVAFTDADLDYGIEEILSYAGVLDKFDWVYDGRDLVYIDMHTGRIKNLEKACNDFSVPKSKAVFIGDNFVGRDENSAKQYGIRFIKVPHFRSKPMDWRVRESNEDWVEYEDPKNPFNFKDLIGKL